MNLRLFSLTCQNEHFTQNYVTMKSTVDARGYTKKRSDDVKVYS